jgi:hypothetical protein
MGKRTMREFDKFCLTPVRPLVPAEICELREGKGRARRFSPAT